jgi:hypothetical protein
MSSTTLRVGPLAIAAEIVLLAEPTLSQQGNQAARMVVNVEPISNI